VLTHDLEIVLAEYARLFPHWANLIQLLFDSLCICGHIRRLQLRFDRRNQVLGDGGVAGGEALLITYPDIYSMPIPVSQN
jgi:hypothetical protein